MEMVAKDGKIAFLVRLVPMSATMVIGVKIKVILEDMMTVKNIEDYEVITVDICDEPISLIEDKKEFIIRDLNGKLIYPNNFPPELRGTKFQLMKGQIKGEA